MHWLHLFALVALWMNSPKEKKPEEIQVQVFPQPVLVEGDTKNQYLNFDFLVYNASDDSVHLSAVRLEVQDEQGHSVMRLFVNRNGLAPSINTIPRTELPGGDTLYLFNPFHTFDATVPLHALHYEFEWVSGKSTVPVVTPVTVYAAKYEAKTQLIFPIKGRFTVYDGHDFYAHHRRVDITHPVAKLLGLRENSGRYAYDLCPVDVQGSPYRESRQRRENWYGYGALVYAPAPEK
jgi:hypothetical protein